MMEFKMHRKSQRFSEHRALFRTQSVGVAAYDSSSTEFPGFIFSNIFS